LLGDPGIEAGLRTALQGPGFLEVERVISSNHQLQVTMDGQPEGAAPPK